MFIPGQTQTDLVFSLFPANEGLGRYAFSHLFMVVNAIAMLSVAFMFLSFNMKPAAATILALSFLFVNMVMQHIPFFEDYRNWFITHHFECWFLVFQQPTPWARVFESESILVGVCTTAFVIGCTMFYVRDIKS